MIRVLFVDDGNDAHSQMAEGLLRYLGKKEYLSLSAGLTPRVVHPLAIMAMGEIGIDIMTQHSKSVEEYLGWRIDHVITMSDVPQTVFPVFPKAGRSVYWQVERLGEGAGEDEVRMNAFRCLRDDLAERIVTLFGFKREDLPKPIKERK